jgi:hypothetical protein
MSPCGIVVLRYVSSYRTKVTDRSVIPLLMVAAAIFNRTKYLTFEASQLEQSGTRPAPSALTIEQSQPPSRAQ